jgi:acyl-CoA reductase-like NAD-dependent aldehyde dehydrogenase
MKKAAAKKPSASKQTAAPKRPHAMKRANDTLRVQAQALKELVSLEKIKQEFLHGNLTGVAELDKLLADYLKVILKLTGTQAGSIMLREGDHLVFRASRGHRSFSRRGGDKTVHG